MKVSIGHYTSLVGRQVTPPLTARAKLNSSTPDNKQLKDTFSISTTAQQKLAEENRADKSNKDPLDKLIDTIKQKIKELNAELKKLASDNSEQAKFRRKLLQQEIAMQNVLLMELLGKKLKSLS